MREGFLLLFEVILCVAFVLVPLPSSDFIAAKSPQGKSIRRTEIRFALTILVLAGGAFLSISAFGAGASWSIPIYLMALSILVLLLIHPWLLTRWVLIPFGLVHLSYHMGRLGGFPWTRDPQGGAVLAAVLALLHKKQPSSAMLQQLADKLRHVSLGGAGIVATGLLYAIRGEVPSARVLLQSLELLDNALCPPLAQRIAVDWQMMDAATRGDWPQIIRISQQTPSSSRLHQFLLVVAKRFCGEAISRRQLLLSWLWAPKRRHSFSLLRRVMNFATQQQIYTEISPIGDLSQIAANDGGHFCLQAFSLHQEILSIDPSQVSESAVLRLACAWDEVFRDPRLFQFLSESMQKNRSSLTPEEVAATLRQHVLASLVSTIREHHLPWQDMSTTKQKLVYELRRELDRQWIQESEQVIQMIDQRVFAKKQEQRSGDIMAEWHFWLMIREKYQQITSCGGKHVCKQIFPAMEQSLSQYARWLWSLQQEKSFAAMIFLWLLGEAESLAYWQSAKIHEYNLVVGGF